MRAHLDRAATTGLLMTGRDTNLSSLIISSPPSSSRELLDAPSLSVRVICISTELGFGLSSSSWIGEISSWIWLTSFTSIVFRAGRAVELVTETVEVLERVILRKQLQQQLLYGSGESATGQHHSMAFGFNYQSGCHFN